MTTTTSTVDTYTAPVDAKPIIKPSKVWEVEPPKVTDVQGEERDSYECAWRGRLRQVHVEEGKRKIPRQTMGISAEEKKPVKSQTRNRELERKTPAAENSWLKSCRPPMVDLGRSSLFEEDLVHVHPQPQLPGPYDLERVRILYTRACDMLKVVPSGRFKRELHSGRVKAGHQGLGPLGIKAVAMSLLTNLTVTELHIPGNKLGPKGMRSVARLLHSNDVIRVLDVSDNQLGSKGAKLLAAAIQENNSLQHIKAAGNKFDDETGRFFEQAFEVNTMINIVDLSRNRFCEQGAFELARGMGKNETVTHLDVSYNCIRRFGIQGVGHMLENNSALMMLNLSWNGIDREGAVHLGQGLNHNPSLTVLNLTGCRLTGASLLQLLGRMKANRALNTLHIPHNPLTNADLTLFLKALDALPDMALNSIDASSITVSLEVLDLQKKLADTRPGFFIIYQGQLSITDHSKSFLESIDLTGGDPMELILMYTRRKKMRLVDTFAEFDTDKNGTLSRKEIIKGLAHAGLPLSIAHLDLLLERLDENEDGQIDYRELVEGFKKFTRRLHKKGSLMSDVLSWQKSSHTH